MHFFYVDESGDTGRDLSDPNQPVLVLGGVSVKDSGWIKTQSALATLFRDYFGHDPPPDFELHAIELLAPNGEGPFTGHPMQARTQLALDALRLVADRGHNVHYIALDKRILAASACDADLAFDPMNPWLLAYDYLITYINAHVRDNLGQHTRGMVIHDQKDSLHHEIEHIAHERRFTGPLSQRVKWIVEFSYPVDSRKNPMIQLSDLVVYCVRRFVELENGYRQGWTTETKQFYADCYSIIDDRIVRKGLIERPGRPYEPLNQHLRHTKCSPRRNWRAIWQPHN